MTTTMTNIASYLPEMAKNQPHTKAVIVMKGGNTKDGSCQSYSFFELNEESNLLATALLEMGIQKGIRTALMVKPSLEFFALTFALFKIGAVPVLIDPGIGIKNLSKCLYKAEPSAFIGIPKAHIARILLGWAKKTIKMKVTVGSRFFWGGETLVGLRERGKKLPPFEMPSIIPADMAAILFTSGSTGIPKGAIYSHRNFMAQVEILKDLYNIQPGEIDLATFPLFALFGPALGMTVVIPDMDATHPAKVHPPHILEPIQEFGITNMFGSPALLNRVSRYAESHQVKLPSLKRVLSAGAPVPGHVLKIFTKVLKEDTQIFTPYGATESLPVCSIGSHEILRDTLEKTNQGLGVCVGRPVSEATVRIIEISDSPIPLWKDDLQVKNGEIGEIVVQGPQVTKSYYNRPKHTDLAKIQDPDQESFYHRMGDLGYFDEQGRLWFCGRKNHRVESKDGVLYTIPCEAVFNTHLAVYRSALVGVGQEEIKTPVLCVELEKGIRHHSFQENDLKRELLKIGSSYSHTRKIQTILIHPAFPVDIRHNSKIFREKLALWAQEQII